MQRSLLDGAVEALEKLIRLSKDEDMVIVAGLPVSMDKSCTMWLQWYKKVYSLALSPKRIYQTIRNFMRPAILIRARKNPGRSILEGRRRGLAHSFYFPV